MHTPPHHQPISQLIHGFSLKDDVIVILLLGIPFTWPGLFRSAVLCYLKEGKEVEPKETTAKKCGLLENYFLYASHL
jgi:hypothetical protein